MLAVMRRLDWRLGLLVLGQAIVFGGAAAFRLIDIDEGYYLLAAQLVSRGGVPYRDFFYPQAPLLPYAYGGWLWAFGESWHVGRALSVTAAVTLGVFLYRHVRWLGASAAAAGLAMALYTFSSLSFGWLPTVKTYAVSALFLFGAYVVVAQAGWNAGIARYGAAGALFGLAVGTRLMLAASLPAFVFGLLTPNAEGRRRGPPALAFVGAAAAAWSVNVVFMLPDPDRFWFNNLGFHSIRSSRPGLFGHLGDKVRVLVELFDPRNVDAAASVQFAILVGLVLGTVITGASRPVRLAIAIAACVAVVSLLPNPALSQYFVVTVPFLVVAAVPALGRLSPARWMLPVTAGLYLLAVPFEAHRYLVTGEAVPGIFRREVAINWRISIVERMAAELMVRTAPGDLVFAGWAGYLVGVDRRHVPGTENHAAMDASPWLSPSQRARYRIPARSEVAAQIQTRALRAAVVGFGGYALTYRVLLRRAGYVPVLTIGATEVYVAPDSPGSH